MPDIDWLEARESFANMDFCRFDLVFSAPDSPRTYLPSESPGLLGGLV